MKTDYPKIVKAFVLINNHRIEERTLKLLNVLDDNAIYKCIKNGGEVKYSNLCLTKSDLLDAVRYKNENRLNELADNKCDIDHEINRIQQNLVHINRLYKEV